MEITESAMVSDSSTLKLENELLGNDVTPSSMMTVVISSLRSAQQMYSTAPEPLNVSVVPLTDHLVLSPQEPSSA